MVTTTIVEENGEFGEYKLCDWVGLLGILTGILTRKVRYLVIMFSVA